MTGRVGIFITSAIGTLVKVAEIGSGDFFGEMAIFDNLARSASCIALEDTIVVAVTKDNLQMFLETCPEIAKKMLENMSGRIRKLDEQLYKNNRFVKNRHVPKFAFPAEYKTGHIIRKPYQMPMYINEYKQACPICGKAFSVMDIKRNILEEKSFELDCRVIYTGCNPLWNEVISCPRCYYTNHYLRFFAINNFEYELIKELVYKEHKPIVEARLEKRSDFDILIMKYLQAININEHVNPGDSALLGVLWRNIYWLSKDANDIAFAKYCAIKASEKFKQALDENQINDSINRVTTAVSLAVMLINCGEYAQVPKYLEIAFESTDERILHNAQVIKNHIEQKNQSS
ncbi:MAG: DUF2225 domain-containing protein [Lachnospiraceae bacterium]|nr:DUF2225 domain-containing protein [Lachnospiraceae bacterium]